MFLGANRLGKMFSGMGGLGRGAYNAGKYGMDKVLANKMMSAAIVTGGISAYSMTRSNRSTGGRVMDAATIGGLGYMAHSGTFGPVAKSYMGAGVNAVAGMARSGLSRMRRF